MIASHIRSRGFTLLEVLVVLVIFVALSLSANRILVGAQQTEIMTEQAGERLKQMQRAMLLIENDIRQMALRPHRLGTGDGARVLYHGNRWLESDDQGLSFVRGGVLNPAWAFSRGEVARVGYRLQDEKLERMRWHYADVDTSNEPSMQVLLEGVEKLQFQFYDKGQWRNDWQDAQALPQALRIKLVLQDYGKIERDFLLTGASLMTDEAPSDV
ncbi:Type II secretion system protein J [Vibrio stylophorae]|uniref:Type II secretion system protein J n=1 Tax=Vibrio stylophorae TaxID=659351 RepID=A0ABN8DQS7_9VIBR|nr:type II secretion system minor pseudopilin GspJ [Vibrio stylophorae]CAH0532342.1 Type II secretion system protein J [Vibrio stylophorae]